MVAFVEVPLGHDDGEFLLFGEGVDGGGVLVAIEIDGLRLLGEHHRCVAEMTRGNTGDTNAGSFNGQDLIDGLTGKMLRPSGAHAVEQFDIALVVEESVHFQHITRLDGTLQANALFELLHESP